MKNIGHLLIGFSAAPVDKFQLRWMPICSKEGYGVCHKIKQPKCAYLSVKKDLCREVKIIITDSCCEN